MLYILSLRAQSFYPAQSCAIELEDVLSEVFGVEIVAPANEAEFTIFCSEVKNQGAEIFLATVHFGQLVDALDSLGDWRKNFSKVYAYVFDSFLSENEVRKNYLSKRFSKFSRNISELDQIFIPIPQQVDVIRDFYRVPVTYVPIAADVDKFGTSTSSRVIDVNAYGRQNAEHVAVLAERFNHKNSDRSLYFTSHFSFSRINNFKQHRDFFWKMLSMSKIALAYDLLRVNPEERFFPCSFVGQRWFESLAAGCVVVGYRPACKQADELLNWEDSTVECPENPTEFLKFVEDFLEDEDRLSVIRNRNYFNMLKSNDWAHRAILIAVHMFGNRVPAGLESRLARLQSKALLTQIQTK